MLHLRVGVADHLYPLIGTAARRSPLPRERFSPMGTFRTWRGVRVESAMRFKADIGRQQHRGPAQAPLVTV